MSRPVRYVPVRFVIEGAAVTGPDLAWLALAALPGLPGHFGRNLDALHDSLTADLPGPIEIEWRDAAASRAALGETFDRLRRTLEEAAEARPDLAVRFRD